MKENQTTTHKVPQINTKKQKIEQHKQETVRTYTKVYVNSKFYRKIVIPLRELVHIKDLNANILNHEADQEQKLLTQEYLLQNSMKSDFVVKNLKKIIEGNKMIWIQQDFFSLLSEFQLSSLSFSQRISIFNCIASGVKDLHQSLICHRSLSASSIAVFKKDDDKYTAKINNFKQATILKNHKSTIEIPTTKINAFSSPELKCGRSYGLASDLWSLGCLLNFILYETTQNIWQEGSQVQIEVPEGTPDWLLELLKSMLHQQPEKRYSINTILEIIKTSLKCIDVLGKYIPLGKDCLKLKKIASQLNCQRQH